MSTDPTTASGKVAGAVKAVAEKAIGADTSAWFRTAIQAGAVGVICHVFMSWSDRVWVELEAGREEMRAMRDRDDASRAKAWEAVRDLRKSMDDLTAAVRAK